MSATSYAPASDVAAIVVAAGSGTRYGGAKQYERLRDQRVLDWSIAAARAVCGTVVVVVHPDRARDPEPSADRVVAGGTTRSASVRAGLDVLDPTISIVVVHDAARPLASPGLFAAVVDAVRDGADGALPGVPVVDTLRRRAPAGARVEVAGGPVEVNRDALVAVQTPQAFRRDALERAHDGAADASDDATLIDRAGGTVVVVPGSARNRKITEPDDLVIAEALLDRADDVAGPGARSAVEVS